MILQVGDILLGKPRDGVLTESEEKWFFIFNTLILYCFNYEMKNNPVTLQSVFEIFNSGKQYEMTKDEGNINLVEKMVKNNLIESEEYEKVIESNDLIVEYRIHSHLKYERKMNDLYCNHSISVLDLIVGTSFEFTTISGKTLEVTVPPKTQPYMHLKLAGHGLPIHDTNAYGDQIILLKSYIPDMIDSRITDSILLSKAQ
jgi:DnaJ-class molecular chaperone